jgi:Double zinc ribbon
MGDMRCPNCDAVIPEGGRFCIECGAQMQPATGATERLPDAENGPRCAACGTRNPPGAQFCVMCGRQLSGGATVAPPPASAPVASVAPAAPVVATPPAAAPIAASPDLRLRNPAMWGGIGGGAFLIGIAVLALTGWWWPGILVILGISALASSVVGGRPWAGLQGALWLFGIAFIAQFNLWWPGILILVGVSAIMGSIWRPHR